MTERGAHASESSPRRFYGVILLLSFAAFVLRLLAARRDFWCDEIWSFAAATQAKSLSDVFANHSDNNHLLNTLWLYLLGDGDHVLLNRLPAVLSGALSVAVAGWMGLKRSRAEACIAMLLVGGAFFAVHYSSEARGYGPLLLFGILAFAALDRFLDAGGIVAAALFVSASLLGLAAHLTFLYAYMGLLVWSVYRVQKKEIAPERLWSIASMHALVLAGIAGFYLVWARFLEIAGGDAASPIEVVLQTCAMALGGPSLGTWMYVSATLALVFSAASLVYLYKHDRAAAVLFVTVLFVAPVFFCVVKPPPFLTPRYFLMAAFFALLLWARGLAAAWLQGGTARTLCALGLVFFLALNLFRTGETIAMGSGGYERAMALMYARSPGSEITVGSDFDARNINLVSYYARRLPTEKHFNYCNANAYPPGGVDWLLIHQLDTPEQPPSEVRDLQGNRYLYVNRFGFADLSGWPWFVYKNAGKPSGGGL